MARTWSWLALVVAVVATVAHAGRKRRRRSKFGVLAYPAGESRITPTCFGNKPDDPFSCGWYCAHAFYVETLPNGKVYLTPFGEANNADNALCSDCSLFEGEGKGKIKKGGTASGTFAGGYKWEAHYDASAQEVVMNYTDYEEPCNIRYIVMEGKVMGVPHASDRPAIANSDATLKKTGWGGPRVVCEKALEECVNWHVYVEGDVADWQSLDEDSTDALCPSRVTPYGLTRSRYMGHDGTPRGCDSFTSGGQVVADRNTIISFSPLNLTRCELYFDVVGGCFQGLGPKCKKPRDSLPTLEDRLAALKAKRAAKQAAVPQGYEEHLQAAGRLPLAKPAHVSAAHWHMAMRHENDFDLAAGEQELAPAAWWVPQDPAVWAGWALAAVVAAAWVGRRMCQQGHHGYKAVPGTTEESSPLLV